MELKGGDPVFSNVDKETVRVVWPLSQGGTLQMELKEKTVSITSSANPSLNWYLDLEVAPGAKLPFTKIASKQLECSFETLNYKVAAAKGSFSKPTNGAVFRLQPEKNTILLNLL